MAGAGWGWGWAHRPEAAEVRARGTVGSSPPPLAVATAGSSCSPIAAFVLGWCRRAQQNRRLLNLLWLVLRDGKLFCSGLGWAGLVGREPDFLKLGFATGN